MTDIRSRSPGPSRLWLLLLLLAAVGVGFHRFGLRAFLLFALVAFAAFALRDLFRRFVTPAGHRLGVMLRDDRERCLAAMGWLAAAAAVQTIAPDPFAVRAAVAVLQNAMLFVAVEAVMAAWLAAGGGRPRGPAIALPKAFAMALGGVLLAALVATLVLGPVSPGSSDAFWSERGLSHWALAALRALPAMLGGDLGLFTARSAWLLPLGAMGAVLFAVVAGLRLSGRDFDADQVTRYVRPRLGRLGAVSLALLALPLAVGLPRHLVSTALDHVLAPSLIRAAAHVALDAATMGAGVVVLVAATTRVMRRAGRGGEVRNG